MGRNNRRRRGGRGRGEQQAAAAEKKPAQTKKNERGVFDFTEEELAEDTSLKLISGEKGMGSTEVKYASFEDYLKDH